MTDTESDLICRTCSYKSGIFDFEESLRRLQTANALGFEVLKKAANREQKCMPKMFHTDVPQDLLFAYDMYESDELLQDLLLQSMNDVSVRPLSITGDGNCLFTSLSILLTGNADRSSELRCRCIIELATKASEYEIALKEYERLDISEISGNVSILDRICNLSTCNGVGEILAAASVSFRSIIIYQPNLEDSSHKVFTFDAMTSRKCPVIMLVSSATHGTEEAGMWLPYHLAPVVPRRLKHTKTKVPFTRLRKKRFNVDLDDFDENSAKRSAICTGSSDLHDKSDATYRQVLSAEERLATSSKLLDGPDATYRQVLSAEERLATSSQSQEEPVVGEPVSSGKVRNFMSLIDIVNECKSPSQTAFYPRQNPTESGTILLTCSVAEAKEDGWRWRNSGGGRTFYVNGNGHELHRSGTKFFKKMRQGRAKSTLIEVTSEDAVFFMTMNYFVHVSNQLFRRRITQYRQISPSSEDGLVLVEYVKRGDGALCFPAHGNSKSCQPFVPTDKETLDEIRDRASEGQNAKIIYRRVDKCRDLKQVYNMKSVAKDVSYKSNGDPWLAVQSQHFLACEGSPFVKAFHVEDQQMSAIMYTASQARHMQLIRFGNPGHIDTTFGSAAYVTYIGYRNVRLEDTRTGQAPFFIGPSMIHSKEKDSNHINLFLLHLRNALNLTSAYIVTDECSVLERRLHEVWPDIVHGLGREHLIANFRENGHKHDVAARQLDKMKSQIFGPSSSSDLPLLENVTEHDFERELNFLMSRWSKEGCQARKFAEWIKVRTFELYKPWMSKIILIINVALRSI